MLERKLFFRLVLPLAIVALVSLALIWPPHLEDLLGNLVVEVASILITVLFVDWVLKNREAEQWRLADALIKADFAGTALRYIAESAIFLTESGWNAPEVAAPTSQTKPWSFVLEGITLAAIQASMSRATQEQMSTYKDGIRERLKDLATQHTRYSPRLSAGDTDSILQFETALHGLASELDLLTSESDLMDLLDDNAGIKEVDELTRTHLNRASEHLHRAVSAALELFERGYPQSPSRKKPA